MDSVFCVFDNSFTWATSSVDRTLVGVFKTQEGANSFMSLKKQNNKRDCIFDIVNVILQE